MSPKPPDGRWGWMVVVGSIICYFLADGWAYSFGVIFTALLEVFDEGKGKTATVGALIYAVPLLISPIPCALCNIYGCRPVAITGGCICAVSFMGSIFANSVEWLMVTLGVAVSVGLALTYVPAILAVMYYFEKRRGLATGLAVTGSGIGAFAYPPLVGVLLVRYSWQGTMLLLGGLSLNIIVAGALFFPLTEPKDSEILCEDATNAIMFVDTITLPANSPGLCRKISKELKLIKNSMCDITLYKNYGLWIYNTSVFVSYLWIGTPYVYLVDKAILLGYSVTEGTLLLSSIAIGRTVGQIALGALADHSKVSKIALYGIAIFTCGVATILLPLCKGYAELVTFSIVFGFFISVTYTLQTLCLVELCGLEKAGSAFGICQLAQGIATLLGTPIPGLFYDWAGSYDPPLYVAGACTMLSALILLPLPIIKSCRNREMDQE